MLSFTADEIWRALPGDRGTPVFAQRWHVFPLVASGSLDWGVLCEVREAVKKVLEDLRAAGKIGSGLNAQVVLHADGELAALLNRAGDELRFWFITSEVQVRPISPDADVAARFTLENGAGLGVDARPSPHGRCERCWHQRPEVGQNAVHPTLCDRCIDNISDERDGERRVYF